MKSIYLSVLLCLLAICGYSQTTYYYRGGTFNSAANWNTAADGSGSPATVFTGAADTWVVTTTNPLTANAAWTVAGALQVNGSMTISTNPTITGGITVNAGGSLLQNAASTATAPNMASVQDGAGIIEYSSNTTHTLPGITYGNLTISGTGANTAGGAITVNGALTVNAGTTLSMSTFAMTAGTGFVANINGTLNTLNTTSTPLPTGITWGGTVGYVATAANQTVRAGTYNNLTIGGASGSRTFTMDGAITVNGNLVFGVSTATLADGGFNISLLGNLTGADGKHTGTGKIVMTGTSATLDGSGGVGNIEFNNAAGFALTGPTTFSGTTTFTAGALTIGSNTMTVAAGTTLVGTSATNCLIGGATSNLTVSSTGNIGNVYFDQTTPGISNTLATLTCSGNGGTTTIANPLTINTLAYGAATTAVLADGGNTITVTGNITGGGRHSGTGKLLMTGAGATISGMSQSGNIELDNPAGFSLSGNLSVNGVLTFTNGKLNIGASTMTIATGGSFAGVSTTNCLVGGATSNFTVSSTSTVPGVYFDQTTPGTTNRIAIFTCSGAAGVTTLASDVVVGTTLALSSSTATMNDGGNVITLLGDISGTGKHTGSGKIYMTGTNKNISGLTGSGNIELDNGGNFNVTGSISCNGTITFTSSTLTLGAITFTILTNGSMSGMSSSKYFIGGASTNFTVNTTGSTGALFFDQTTPGTSNNIVTFTNSAGTTTLGSALNVSTGLTLTAGTFDDNGNIVTVSGNISGSNGVHTGAGKIVMTGSGKTVSATVGGLNNLELNNVSGFSLSSTLIVNGALTFTSGKLALGARSLILKGTVAGMSATNCFTGGASSLLTVNTAGSVGSLYFDQTTPGTTNNISTFTNTAGTTDLGNAVSIATLALTAGTLNDNGNVITLTGSITGAGTHTSGVGGKIKMTGLSKSISNVTLGNVEFNYASGASAFTLSNNPIINGDLSFTGASNTLTIGGHILTLNGTVTGMSSTKFFTGSTTSNIVVGSTGALGTIFLCQTSGTTRTLQTLTVSGGGSVTMGTISTISTTLALTNGTLNDGGLVMTLSGNITGTGNHVSTTGGKILMTGASKTISGATLGNLELSNAAAFSLTGSPTVNGALTFTSGTLTVGSNTLTLAGTVASMSAAKFITGSATSGLAVTSTGALGTLFLNPATAGTSNNFATFELNGVGGTTTLGNALSAGTLALTSGTLAAGANNISVTGNVTGTGTHTSSTGVITMTGAGATLSGATLGNLTLNNAGGFSLTGSPTVAGTLTLTAGNLDLSSNDLTLTGAAAIAGTPAAGKMIVTSGNGQLRKSYSANGSYTFPVGDNSGNYTPVMLNMTSGAFGGGAYVGVGTTNAKHPQNSNANNYLKRYWTINTSSITSPAYSLTATYVPGDIVGTEGNISGAKYTGSLPWVKFGGVSANTLTTSSISNTSVAISGVSGVAPTVTGSSDVTICAGGSTNLSVVSSTGSPTLTYSWAPATGLSATTGSTVAAAPTVTTTYTLTVTDGNGEIGVDEVIVTVTTAPVAAPANDGYICNGGTVNLTANASGSTSTYSWSGANLSATTIANPMATPTSTTIYTLTVSDGTANAGCSVAFTTTADVHATPSAAPTNNGYICNGGTVTLSANPANGAATYAWSGANLSSGSVQNPTATPTITAVYTLTVSDGSGKSGCAPATAYTTAVTVNAVPTAAPTNSGYICNGGTVVLTANPGGGATSYNWSGSNLSSGTDQNPTATPTSSTVYTLTVSGGSGNPGCAPTTQYTTAVTVNTAPTAAPSNDGYICNGGTVNLTANPAGGATVYNWSGGSLSSSTTQNPSAMPTSSTVYTLTVSDGSGHPGCAPATQYTTAVTVNTVPTAAPVNDGYICNGGTATLAANPANGATTYIWSGGGLSSTTVQNPTAAPSSSTVYTLTVSDGSGKSGCAPSTQYTTAVTVNSVPTAAPSSDGPICVGGTANLSANPASGATMFTWSGANLSSSTAQNPTAAPTSSSVYTLTVSDGTSHSGCSPSTQYTVAVTANPLPSLSSASTGGSSCAGITLNLMANDPANVTGYNWSGPNSFTSTDQNPTISSPSAAANGTYTVTVNNGTASGCTATYTTTATVTSGPVAITGTLSTCEGNTTTLSNLTSGGSWISSNTSVATVGSSTGVVQGLSAGNTTITYKIGATGCYVIAPVTVNVQPAAILGTGVMCYGAATTLTNAVAGGVWSSANAAVAPVDATGVVTGVNQGTATISYTMGAGTGCRATRVVTVNSVPTLISGTPMVCENKTTTLSDAITGGTWSSADLTVATVGATNGVVTGVSAGNTNITYMNSNGCYRYVTTTVNQAPTAFTGNAPVCIGATITLSNPVPGGTWSNSGPTATTESATGIMTGVSAGTPVISYTLPNGCRLTENGTVNTTPGTFGGNFVVCAAGSTVSINNTPSGGVWSSSNTAMASVGTSGVVTGVAGGNPTITYTLSNGCYNTKQITVNPIAAITGLGTGVCVGSTLSLGETVDGGVWSSSSVTRATVDASGVVSGVAAGAANISYTMPSGCKVWVAVPVNPITAITGTPMACEGLTTTLADATTGGAWSSGNLTVATVGTSGIVTGGTAGVATVSYQTSAGCLATQSVTINQAPVAISGGTTVCAGSLLTLSNAVSGGTWTSSSTAVATVGSTTGIVTGVAGGNATITYSNGPGCSVTKAITVSPILPITGTNSACIGMTTTLSDASAGGTWSSSNLSVATIGTSGIVSGLSSGITTVTYALPSGCARTIAVSVNPVPVSISGAGVVCASLTTTLSGDNIGGTWTSSNAAIATVGSTTGVVTGVAAGTVNITYNMGLNCRIAKVVTVNSSPAITGTTKACIGTSTALSHSITGGAWETSNPSIATVGVSSGIVTGVAAGTTTITYTPPSGCLRTIVVTINSLPGANGGVQTVCVGSTTLMTNATSGGVSWVSSDPSVATVGATSAVVTGISAGTATMTYNVNTGCYSTSVVTVNPIPGTITGSTTICAATTATLGNPVAGGTWSSSNAALASVGSSDGVLSALVVGSPRITYTLSNGCSMITTVTVLGNAVNTGTPSVCIGATVALSNTTTGGVWSSSDASVATVGTSGVVTGVASGNADISYTNPAGCVRVSTATVNVTPGPITGSPAVCVGFTTTLGNAVAGGVWSNSTSSIATLGSTGVITGLLVGTTNISYTIGSCRTIQVYTVNGLPSPISGSTSMCVGANTTLSDATPGGIWSGGVTSIVALGTSGVVSGLVAGNAQVTYTAPTGCYRAVTVVVNPTPAPISGLLQACPGTTTVLTDATSGGVSFTSSNPSVATVGATSGVVTGITVGTSTLTYTVNTGCYVTADVTINPTPSPITGASNVCPGLTLTLADADAGGTWSSYYLTVGSTDGIVTGVGVGARPVTYTLPTGCSITTNVTVNPVADISGFQMLCIGAVEALGNSVASGTWSSSNASVATIGSTSGTITALSAGTSTISYTTPAGCIITRVQTVNALAGSGTISGATTVVAGLQVTLSDDIMGGSWASSDPSKATVETNTGIVTGVSAGNTVISYTVDNGCGPITGTYTVSVAAGRYGGNMAVNNAVDFTMFPNPNKGEFTIKGALESAKDQDIYVEVANVLGQVVYQQTLTAHNGVLEERVGLGSNLPNGTYTLKLNLPGETKVFHFVINH